MLLLLLFILTAQEEGAEAPQPDAFKESQLKWRADRETKMKADDSWLNLVGLFWLKEGENPFGSRQDLRISLPTYSTVERAGSFFLEDGKVRYTFNRGQRAVVDGETRNEGPLEFGEILAHNHLRMFLIKRGERIALRVRDLRAKNFRKFEGLDFYRPKDNYVIEGFFQAYDPPKTITITTVVSTEIEMIVPGVIHFDFNGQQLELIPTLESAEDEQYLIMFQDKSSGTTTYSGGRFLYVDPPQDNKVVLDFNHAINPPCAYTVYATCPLPPAENWLDVAIEAGERVYTGHDDDH